MNSTNKKLIELVLSKTNQKLISWSRGSSINEYRTDLNAASLNISRGISELPYGEYITLSMYNGTGAAITLAHVENGDLDFDILDQLYIAAQDSCTKESETIDMLFQELHNLGSEQ